jgi:hypothetical protein
MDDDDWLAGLLTRVGEPVPCAVCGTPTPPTDLTETAAPGALIRDWDIAVQRVIWVCPACPVP